MPVSLVVWRVSIGSFYFILVPSCAIRGTEKNFSNLFRECLHAILAICNSPILKLFFGVAMLFCYCFFIVSLFPIILFCSLVFTNVHDILFYDSQWSAPSSKIYLVIDSFFIANLLIKYIYPVTVNLMCITLKAVIHLFTNISNSFFSLTICRMLLLISGSVEKNPGPKRHEKNSLSFAMWNLDSIPARDYCRLPLIESFQAVYDFDIFGACETSLTDLIPNENIFIHGFSPEPFRSNKPQNAHSGGVCLYYKPNLPIKQRKDLEIISETIVAELTLKKKRFFLFFHIVIQIKH